MWESLKKLLGDTEKAIVVEDGEVKYVILSVNEYLRLRGQDPGLEAPGQVDQAAPFAASTTPTGVSALDLETPIRPASFGGTVRLSDVGGVDQNELGNENPGSSEINLDDLPF